MDNSNTAKHRGVTRLSVAARIPANDSRILFTPPCWNQAVVGPGVNSCQVCENTSGRSVFVHQVCRRGIRQIFLCHLSAHMTTVSLQSPEPVARSACRLTRRAVCI